MSFGSMAADYDRFRPEPPAEAIEWILPSTVKTIAEIGAGTGALTRQLIGRAPEVIAIEPDERMRAVLEERAKGAVVAMEGRGEELPLADGSVDAVLAASCWHWVDQEKGFAEVARVLRPGGVLGLLWTGPDRSIPWVSQLMAGGVVVSDEERAKHDIARNQRHRPEMPEGAPFSAPEVKIFRFTHDLTPEQLAGLPTTYSVAIDLTPEERLEFAQSVERFVTSQVTTSNGRAELPNGCIVWRAYRL